MDVDAIERLEALEKEVASLKGKVNKLESTKRRKPRTQGIFERMR